MSILMSIASIQNFPN